MCLKEKRILLIISGGIAAYKTLDVIRRLHAEGAFVQCIMTQAACRFITPLSVETLSENPVFRELLADDKGHNINHIRLSRETDLILVAPATADLIAKMAHGHADDLASTLLLAANKPVFIAPAMNPKMWSHPATRRNRKILAGDGVCFIGPEIGEMAERGEFGEGRMSEPSHITAAVKSFFAKNNGSLKGLKIIITSGPTHEPIDPVRYIGNRSSGKQGYAIAQALADKGADVYLVSGPVSLENPENVQVIRVETAQEMYKQVDSLLPADGIVCVAAVADWRVEHQKTEKIKKTKVGKTPVLHMLENPDILHAVSHHKKRPKLVIGFSAETENIKENTYEKLIKKGADVMIANDVGTKSTVLGGEKNRISVISRSKTEEWPEMSKTEIALKLATLIEEFVASK